MSGKWRRSGECLGLCKDKVVAGIPALTDQVQMASLHVPDNVVQMLSQLYPKFLLGPDRRDDLVRFGVKDVDRRRSTFTGIFEVADHAVPVAGKLDVVDTTR